MNIIKQRLPELIFATVIVVGLFLLYATGFNHRLIFDDAWIASNVSLFPESISLDFNFRSLWRASFQIVHQLFGADLYWQRVFNVLLHVINAILIWVLTLRLLSRALNDEVKDENGLLRVGGAVEAKNNFTAVARVAVPVSIAFWAANPVAVYAVQYLTQRSTLMATGFVVSSLLAFIAAMQARSMSHRIAWVGVTAVAYLLAVLSKEHAAPGMALLLPLYLYWRRPSGSELRKGMVVFITLGAVVATGMVYKKGWIIGAATEDMVQPFLTQLNMLRPGASEQVYLLSVVNQVWLFFRYGLLWFMPWVEWLSIDIRTPFPLTWYAFPQILGIFAFVGLLVAGFWALRQCRGRKALFGLIVLVPIILFSTELAFVRIQEPFVLYRSYLWSITLPVLWSILLLAIFDARQWILAAGLMLMGGGAALAFERIQSMRDDGTVWRDALSKIDINGPMNEFGRWRAPHNLARWDLAEHRFADAYIHAKLADQLGAPDGLAKQKMGSALVSLRRPQEALPLLLAAYSEGYKGPELWVSIGSAFDQLGRVDEAFIAYDRALEGGLDERFRPSALLAAGHLANRSGRFHKAENYFSELIHLQPDLSTAIAGLAFSWFHQGHPEKALALLTETISRRPAAEIYYARAELYLQSGSQHQAAKDIGEALARDPQNPVYRKLQRQIEDGSRSEGVSSNP